MAMREEDLISQAIAATEKEIFGEAFEQNDIVHDETGDRSNEQMGTGLEGQHELDQDDDFAADEEAESEDESGDAEGEQDGEHEAEDQAEDQAEDEAEDEAEEGSESHEDEDTAEAEAAPPEPPQGRVPSGRLREQTERADRAEQALRDASDAHAQERAEFNRKFDDLNGRLTSLVTALQNTQRTAPGTAPFAGQPQPDTPPDVFENPQGWNDYQARQRQSDLSRVEQMLATMRFQHSVDLARVVHGDKFEKAWEAANKLSADKPDELAIARQIFAAPNPGAEMMKWHARNETMRVVGDDPDKYRQTVANELREALINDPEFRQQVINDLRAEATGETPSKPRRTITRLPKSLNGATGQSQHKDTDPLLYDDSDSAVFNSAWR